MATHCSVLAWRIPGMVEPRGLLSVGSHRVGHDWSGLAAAVHTPIYTFSWKCSTDPHKFDPIYSLHFLSTFPLVLAFLVAQIVKCLSATWETQVQSLGREDPLEKEMATHSSTLAWKIPWTEEPGRLWSMGSQRVGYNWVTSFSFPFSLVTAYMIHIKCMFINVKCSFIWRFGCVRARK